MKSRVVLLSIKVAVITESLTFSLIFILFVLITDVSVASTTAGDGLVRVAGGRVGNSVEVAGGSTAVGDGKMGGDAIAVGRNVGVGAGTQAAIKTTARMSMII